MLWILAGVSFALLIYEAWTLVGAVLVPLAGNPYIIETDLHFYYDAARRFQEDASHLYRLSDNAITGFAYPPPAILPFVLLSGLPFGAAMWAVTLASYAAAAGALAAWTGYLSRRGLAIDTRTALAAALVALALGPTYSNAIFGQVNAFVLICAVGFVTAGATRPALGGTLLALGAWLKIYPALMVSIGLWNRSAWRAIAWAAAAGAMLFVVTLPILPLATYATFFGDVLPSRLDSTAVHILNQSLIAFLERFSVPPERFLNWTGEQAVTVSASVRALNWVAGAGIIALLWRRAAQGPGREADAAAGLIALAAVIAPLGWGHTFVLVLPLVVLHLVTLPQAPPWRAAVVFGCVLALMVPAARRFGFVEQLAPWMQNIVYSRYLFATLILIALPAAAPDLDSRR